MWWRRLPPEARASMLKSLQICAFFGSVSVLISIVYKVLLSKYDFQARFLLLAAQQAICLAFCIIMQRVGALGIKVPPLSLSLVRTFLIPGILFVGNIMVGWLGLQLVNIPLFLCIRRTTVAFALVAELVILRKPHSNHILSSVSLIVMGAIVAGYSTFSSDWVGIAFTVGNNVLTAAQLATTKSASDSTGLRGFGIVYVNALVALPLCLLGATLAGEWEYAARHAAVRIPLFWTSAAVASSMGVLMTYSTILCSTQVSPLATTVTGNVKDVLATVVGAFAFGDFDGSITGIGGILLSFAGAGWFSAAKLIEQQQAGGKALLPVNVTTITSSKGDGGEGDAGGLAGTSLSGSSSSTSADDDTHSSGSDESGPDTGGSLALPLRPPQRRAKAGQQLEDTSPALHLDESHSVRVSNVDVESRGGDADVDDGDAGSTGGSSRESAYLLRPQQQQQQQLPAVALLKVLAS